MDRFSDLPLELFQSLLLLYLTKKELSVLSRTSTHLRRAHRADLVSRDKVEMVERYTSAASNPPARAYRHEPPTSSHVHRGLGLGRDQAKNYLEDLSL